MNLPSQALPLPTAYFDKNSGGYWYQDAKGAWVRFQQNDFVRFLKDSGYSGKVSEGEAISSVDCALMSIQMNHNVDYAGPVAGHQQGLINMEGKSVLVTDNPKIIVPEPGEFVVLHEMLVNMLGEEQLQYFQAWVKLAYESLVTGQLRSGHALIMAGPRASGKSLVQQIVTRILGGRAAHPYLHMTGGTSFNSELFGAEHLIIDDQCGNTEYRSRQKLTAQFKVITAAGSQQCHPKGKPSVTLKLFWRLTVSVNNNPESLLVLPLIREDLEDKVMVFKIEHHVMPMPTRTGAEQEAFWNQLMADLPHWLHYLGGWEIPAAMADHRFGVNHYHHPEIIEAIDCLSPDRKLYALLETLFRGRVNPWIGTAAELEALLTEETAPTKYEARKLFSFTTACGVYLARLGDKYQNVISREDRHDNRHRWRICFADNVGVPAQCRAAPCIVEPPPTPALALLS